MSFDASFERFFFKNLMNESFSFYIFTIFSEGNSIVFSFSLFLIEGNEFCKLILKENENIYVFCGVLNFRDGFGVMYFDEARDE